MVPSYVMVKDLREGLPVEYLGEEAGTVVVVSDALSSRGMALFPGHPGRVWGADPHHVQVSWVGLEQEPASYALGFSTTSLESNARFPGLGLLAEAEFAKRAEALAEILTSEGHLSHLVPPWRTDAWGRTHGSSGAG